jgi:curved DNA-binding protein CbpA
MPMSTSAYDHHYAVLGLTKWASLDEIRSAYKKMVLIYNPTISPNAEGFI